MSQIQVVVTAIDTVAEGIRRFTLAAADGNALPAFSGGSHVVVSMPADGRTYRNAYSLMSSPEERRFYQIAVRLQDISRGGSRFMHETVAVGHTLAISWPVNLFGLSRAGRSHLLIAGGIGITPILSQLHDACRLGVPYQLHYAFRSPLHAAFTADIDQLADPDKRTYYDESRGQRIDFPALLALQPLGTHVYVCGPSGMVAALVATARELGWSEQHIHTEQFLAPAPGEPFRAELKASGKSVEVPADMSLLEAMEEAGVEAPYLCRGGACGRCELEVLDTDGELLHHDHYLSEAEKAAGNKIMPCVSRAKCTFIALNL